MNVAALASTSHQPGLFDMVASPWLAVRVGGSKPPGSYTAYCPNVNLGGRRDQSPAVRRPPLVWHVSPIGGVWAPGNRPRRGRGGRSAPPRPAPAPPRHDAPRPPAPR